MRCWSRFALAVCVATAAVACGERAADPNPTDPRPAGSAPGAAPAADPGYEATTRDTADGPGRADRNFVEEMMVDNRAEVELGQLAQKKAQNKQVRDFAAMMVRDHQRKAAELKELATHAQVDGASVDADHSDVRTLRERLDQHSGAEFDREYMSLMVEKHEKAVEDTRARAEGADNEQVRQWAAKTLPALQKHLEQARQIHATLEKRPRT